MCGRLACKCEIKFPAEKLFHNFIEDIKVRQKYSITHQLPGGQSAGMWVLIESDDGADLVMIKYADGAIRIYYGYKFKGLCYN